jgi:antitoxin HicB
MRFIYPVELEEVREGPPEDHCVLATFPDLPEANTFGKDRADALASAVECLEVALAGRIKDRADIPEPSPARGRPTVAPGNLIAAKAALYLAMRQENVRPAELARRMNVDQPSINRLLDPRHASRPAQFDAAFAALGKRLVLSLENAA